MSVEKLKKAIAEIEGCINSALSWKLCSLDRSGRAALSEGER